MKVNFSYLVSYCEKSWQDALRQGEAAGGTSPWGNSRYQDFKKCPYYYQFFHVHNMTLREPDENLEIGGLFHEMLAKFYHREVDEAIDTLVGLIEPFMIISLGIGVGLLLVSILVPIYNIAGGIS